MQAVQNLLGEKKLSHYKKYQSSILTVGGVGLIIYIVSVIFPLFHYFCLIGAGLSALMFTKQNISENKDDAPTTLTLQLETLFAALSHAIMGYFLSIAVLPFGAYRLAHPTTDWKEIRKEVSRILS